VSPTSERRRRPFGFEEEEDSFNWNEFELLIPFSVVVAGEVFARKEGI
jgi:hypothetical protein